MANEQDGLFIPVGLTLEEAQLALKRLEEMAKAAGARVRDELGRGGQAAGAAAGKGIGHANNFLAEFRQSAGRARGAALYFTQAIDAIGGSSSTASKLAGSLVSGLMIGGPMGLAVAGVNALIGVFRDLKEEERKAAEVAKKAAADRVTAYNEARDAIAKMQAQERGQAAVAQLDARKQLAAAENDLGRLETQRRRLEEQAAEAKKRMEAARAEAQRLAAGSDPRLAAGSAGLAVASEAALKDANRQLDETDAQIVRARMTLKAVREKTGAEIAAATVEENKKVGQALVEAEEKKTQIAREAAERRFALEQDLAGRRVAAAKAETTEVAEVWKAEQDAALRRGTEARQLARTGALGVEAQLAEMEFETAQRLAQIAELEAEGLVTAGQAEIARTQIAREETEKRIALLRRESIQSRFFHAQMARSGQTMANALVGEFGKLFRGSRAYEQAMRDAGEATSAGADLSIAAIAKMTQETLASFAEQALVEGLMEVARGIAALARYDYGAASQHFGAAAAFGVAGAAAGAAAMAIGATRGMTKDEKAQVNAARKSAAGGDVTAPGAIPASDSVGGYQGGAAVPGETSQVRELVLVIGDPFETPAETARRAARRLKLAKDLNMIRSDA